MQTDSIRPMTRPEVDVAVDWAAAEGWNPGLHDADCFFAADPEGFLAGFVGDELVATISVVQYGTDFGFLGFYIVKPAFRGQGYGLKLWEAGMSRLANRVVGLDGVVDQQSNYRKSGFEFAYNNIRFEGRATGTTTPHSDVRPLASIPFGALADYDRAFFPEDRAAFLKSWISRPGTIALGIPSAEGLSGYGVMRPCRTGFKIGPLFADTPDGAEQLFQSLAATAPRGHPIFLDVPQVNGAAMALATRHGMKPVFETARMYKGTAPDVAVDRTYGVTSFELG